MGAIYVDGICYSVSGGGAIGTLPTLPTKSGKYNLYVKNDNGTPKYLWVEEDIVYKINISNINFRENDANYSVEVTTI